MTVYERVSRKQVAVRFAFVGGLVLILLSACASALSMLIWGP